jgi:hypothetical protein
MWIVEKIFQNSEFLGFVVGVGKVSVVMADDAASQAILFPTNRDNVLNSSSVAEISSFVDFVS